MIRSRTRGFTDQEWTIICEAAEAALARMDPETRERVDPASFTAGFVGGLTTSLTRIQSQARVRAAIAKRS